MYLTLWVCVWFFCFVSFTIFFCHLFFFQCYYLKLFIFCSLSLSFSSHFSLHCKQLHLHLQILFVFDKKKQFSYKKYQQLPRNVVCGCGGFLLYRFSLQFNFLTYFIYPLMFIWLPIQKQKTNELLQDKFCYCSFSLSLTHVYPWITNKMN